MKLLIVESPTKAQHIQHFLGDGWLVKASLGHVRDLEKTGDKSHVRPPDFKMNYQIIDDKHKEIVAGLKAADAKADGVYLATDPDREGEAIAWHLCRVLGIRPADAKRVTYQEVTESAVKKAVANPRNLDMKLVAAQEVRRGLDRMVGWECSGPLSNVVGSKASAGRVQTPALRVIVEREQAIRAFKPTAFYQVLAHMPGGWRAAWMDGVKDGEYFQDKAFADALAGALPGMTLAVTQAESRPVKKGPPPPFTTSTLQQDGSRALKIGTEAVMKAAQALFEQGAITYHRTDSPNLSEEGERLLIAELKTRALPWAETPRRWKVKEGAQEAHEAIRPTDPSQDEDETGQDAIQRALYSLIWKRAMASQMVDAVYQQTTAVMAGGSMRERPLIFKATGSVLSTPGWKKLYQESRDEEEQPEAANPVPVLQIGAIVKPERGEVLSKSTKAPARFTEATLIKALEDHGVGRPSTYASIIKGLFARAYMEQKNGKPLLYATQLGEAVVGALAGRFDFADLDWTRQVEYDLDAITQGQAQPRATMQKAWDSLQAGLQGMPSGEGRSAIPCPVEGCTGQARRLESKKRPGYFFWACSNRETHGLLQDADGQPGHPFEDRPKPASQGEGPDCPKCKIPTGRLTTSTGKPYFRCTKCSTSWWPDKGEADALGEKWKPLKKGGKK